MTKHLASHGFDGLFISSYFAACSRWHFVPSAVLFVFIASPPPSLSLKDPNGIKFFYKAFWAILGTLQLFIICV